MTKKSKVAKMRVLTGYDYNMATRSKGQPIFVDMPPRTPKAIFEAAKKANKRFDLENVKRLKNDLHYEWEFIVNDEEYTRTDEQFPETFQQAKDERDAHLAWVKKTLGRKWIIDHHEKGLYSILKLKLTKKKLVGLTQAQMDQKQQFRDFMKGKGTIKKSKKKSTLADRIEKSKPTRRFKSTVGKTFPPFTGDVEKEIAKAGKPLLKTGAEPTKKIPTKIAGWESLAFAIVKKYGVGGFKDTSASLAGILLRVSVPVSQGDRIGKNLSSQVAKYKKRHGLTFKTRMERTQINIGGQTSVSFLIRKL